MTINILTSLILRVLSGGNVTTDTRFDRREIHTRIRQSLNEMLKGEVLGKMGQSDRTPLSSFIGTYSDQAILEDGDDKYVPLPGFFVSLSHNRGLHAVYLNKDRKNPLIRRNQPYASANIRSSTNMEGRGSYFVEGSRIVFDKPEKIGKSDTVTLKLIVAAPDTIGVDDLLPIYPEMEAELQRMVLKDMGLELQIPEDRINDSNPNVETK